MSADEKLNRIRVLLASVERSRHPRAVLREIKAILEAKP